MTLLWAVTSPGEAQLALDWRRGPDAEGCADTAAVREAVTARVGPAFVPHGEGATRVLEGEVTALRPGHQVHIRLREQSGELLGERSLVDPSGDCSALTEATALAIAILFESAPPPMARPPARPGPAPSRRWQYAVSVGALGSLGLLPSARSHGFVGLRVEPRPRFALEIQLVGLGGARTRLGGDSLGSARFSTLHALLAGCGQLVHKRRLTLDACVGLIAGALRARGSGFSERDYRSAAPLIAGSARLASELALLGPLYAALAVGMGVPFTHARFVALDASGQRRELMDTRPVFATVELGLRARF